MKRFAPLFVLVFVLNTGEAALRKWNERMQELAGVLNDLLPEISRSNVPASDNLVKNAKRFSELVHSLDVQPGGMSLLPPDSDPTLTLVQNAFEKETKRAYRAIKEGHVDYGKAILRTATGYCVACHSRNSNGPDFPTFQLSPKADTLTSFEKAQLLAATRQYDGAIDTFAALARDAAYAKARPLEWNRAVKHALNLAVRVKEDPDRALAILSGVPSAVAAQFMMQDMAQWKKSLEAWKKEKDSALNSEAALYRKAKKLIDQARSMQQFPIDRSADVLYLRASALLHNQLKRAPQGPLAAEALYLLGKSYEVFGDLQNERWHELFYEACIRNRPHSPVALSCYEAYESSLYFGYTGSGGTALPDDVQTSLAELKTQASPTSVGAKKK